MLLLTGHVCSSLIISSLYAAAPISWRNTASPQLLIGQLLLEHSFKATLTLLVPLLASWQPVLLLFIHPAPCFSMVHWLCGILLPLLLGSLHRDTYSFCPGLWHKQGKTREAYQAISKHFTVWKTTVWCIFIKCKGKNLQSNKPGHGWTLERKIVSAKLWTSAEIIVSY